LRKLLQAAVYLVLATVAAGSMWFYVIGILRAHQIADTEARQVPRGNLSDLYPRWWGARELLLHHRNPYSCEIALEIQEGYYGRRLDAAKPNDPKDQQAFAYPLYVVFVLAPLVTLPFDAVMVGFYWFLVVATAASVWLWLRVLRWQLPPTATATCIILALGCFPAVQGIKLQQISLLVAALLAGAVACAASGWLLCSGTLLALATIKPQLAWPLVAWLLLWTVSDWRARRKLAISFAVVMALLLVGSEIILPGWWRMFIQAIQQYHQYTQNRSVLEVLLGPAVGSGGVANDLARILELIAVLACGPVLWKLRKLPAEDSKFGLAAALAIALTVFVVPMSAPYNQILLLPAILLLVRGRVEILCGSAVHRLFYAIGVLLVAWQWIASFCLSAIYILGSRAWALSAWKWPLFTSLAVPVWIFALTFVYAQNHLGELRQPRLHNSSIADVN
jgi:Glycosyltransferase family 87